jgi:hypothetical protein
LLGCEPEEEIVIERRNRADPQSYARQLLQGTGIMLVDTGFATTDSFTVEQQAHALGIPQREVVRLETLAERLLPGAVDTREWLAGVGAGLEDAFANGAVGVKTICAYRASLKLTTPDEREVVQAFQLLKRETESGQRPRLRGNALCHALLRHASRLCAHHGIPLQVHCGFGDPDEDLAETSPLGLRPLFVDSALSGLKVVLLHCYPYHREAAYLCSVFPGVYMDLSLAIPLAARDGQRALQEALGLCPISKLVYASDASRYPEVFFLAAALHREALAEALVALVDGGFLAVGQAIDAGRDVLAENARRVYRLS